MSEQDPNGLKHIADDLSLKHMRRRYPDAASLSNERLLEYSGLLHDIRRRYVDDLERTMRRMLEEAKEKQ